MRSFSFEVQNEEIHFLHTHMRANIYIEWDGKRKMKTVANGFKNCSFQCSGCEKEGM
jgi:hypothetical protein